MAQDKAGLLAQLLEREILAGLYGRQGSPLPTVRRLSAQWAVSQTTVVGAFKILTSKGRISRPPGTKRYRLCPVTAGQSQGAGQDRESPGNKSPAVAPVDPPPTDRSGSIASQLRLRLVAGDFADMESLPSMKALAHAFRCHHSTLKRALEHLVGDGVLVRRGEHFRLNVPGRAPGPESAVYLAGRRNLVHNRQHAHLQLIRGLEGEIHRLEWRGLRLFASQNPMESEPPPDHLVGGYVYLNYGRDIPWIRFLDSKAHTLLAILDFAEQMKWTLAKHRNYCIVRPDNRRAGREMALHLQSRGHRQVAFFSPHSLMDPPGSLMRWLCFRFQGLQEIFTPDRLTAFAPRTGKAVTRSGTGKKLGELMKEMKLAGFIPGGALSQGFHSAFTLCELEELAQAIRPAFEEALDRKRVTAWICANDEVALLAHAFLAGKAPGRSIALTGFDNTLAAYHLDITSYDFCFDHMGQAAVRWLAHPASVPLDDRRTVTMTGHVVARASTIG